MTGGCLFCLGDPGEEQVMTDRGGIMVLLVYSALNLATGTFNPFLYFQF